MSDFRKFSIGALSGSLFHQVMAECGMLTEAAKAQPWAAMAIVMFVAGLLAVALVGSRAS